MKSHSSYFKSQIGFTLIEVAISITLVALIATILYGAFSLSHRAVEKTEARSEESATARSMDELLTGYIRSAYPYRCSVQNPSVSFDGDESKVEFVSALSLGMGGRGMAKVRIAWDGTADEGGKLTLAEKTPAFAECGGGEGFTNSVVLGQEVRHFRIDYADPQGEEDAWVERWDGTEKRRLPQAVRFSFRDDRGEEIQQVFPIMLSILSPQ